MTRWWLQDDDYHTTGTQKMSKRWNTENLIAQVCQIQMFISDAANTSLSLHNCNF